LLGQRTPTTEGVARAGTSNCRGNVLTPAVISADQARHKAVFAAG